MVVAFVFLYLDVFLTSQIGHCSHRTLNRLCQFITKRAVFALTSCMILCMQRLNHTPRNREEKRINKCKPTRAKSKSEINCKITRYRRAQSAANEIFIWKNLNQLCIFWNANWERIQICSVIYMAIFFLHSICFVFALLFVGAVVFHIKVSNKTIYWFDLRSFRNRFWLLCVCV